VYIFPGNGDGTFRQRATYDLPGAFSPVVADFNGDGNLDLVVDTTGDGPTDSTRQRRWDVSEPSDHCANTTEGKEDWAAAKACLSWSMISTAMGSWMWRIVLLDMGRSELY
jgi:hypothetical protein